MLTIFGAKSSRFCDGTSRRDFLKVGALGLGGLTLADVAQARSDAAAAGRPARDTACILVWCWGGPSHLDTFDLKPDAPAEFRGEFRPIRTKVPGLEICELLPKLARAADQFTLIRSVSHDMTDHATAVQQVLAGWPAAIPNRTPQDTDYPDIAAVFKHMRGRAGQQVPCCVTMPFRFQFGGSAYLGKGCDPFVVQSDPSQPGFRVPNLTLTNELTPERLQERLGLVRGLDQLRRDVDTNGQMDAMDRFQQEAVALLTGDQARRAFDIDREPDRLRDRYGRNQYGQSLLLARRLVEAGIGLVCVNVKPYQHPVTGTNGWDHHAPAHHIFETLRGALPIVDQSLSALIEDIFQRGLDRQTLVLVMGDFGRTPKINVVDGRPGRDHWPQAMWALLSGGGMRMGQVIGSTTAKGEYPKDRRLHPNDVLATVYRFLGIDLRQEFHDRTGRPLAILPGGQPIAELLGLGSLGSMP